MATPVERLHSILEMLAEIQKVQDEDPLRLERFSTELAAVDVTLSEIIDHLHECGVKYGAVYEGQVVTRICTRRKDHDGDHDELGDD